MTIYLFMPRSIYRKRLLRSRCFTYCCFTAVSRGVCSVHIGPTCVALIARSKVVNSIIATETSRKQERRTSYVSQNAAHLRSTSNRSLSDRKLSTVYLHVCRSKPTVSPTTPAERQAYTMTHKNCTSRLRDHTISLKYLESTNFIRYQSITSLIP